MTKKKRKPRAGLLGVGLDNEDGHKRITTGDQFILVGGSEETHERMTETVVKTFEELKRRDRQLEEVGLHLGGLQPPGPAVELRDHPLRRQRAQVAEGRVLRLEPEVPLDLPR